MLYSLATRARFSISALHDRDPLYVQLSNGDIRNNFEIKLLNMQGKVRRFVLYTQGLNNVTFSTSTLKDNFSEVVFVTIEPDRVKSIRVFVTVQKNSLPDNRQQDFKIIAQEINGPEQDIYAAKFHAPKKPK